MRNGSRGAEPAIGELIALRLSRRAVLKGIAAGGAFGLFGCGSLSREPQSAADGSAPLGFVEVPRSADDMAHVARGYQAQVLIRHGDPIRKDGPQFRPGRQTAEEQAQQFGADNDFIAYMPLPRGSTSSSRGLLGVNHENARRHLIWPGLAGKDGEAKLTRDQMAVQNGRPGLLDHRSREERERVARGRRERL